jgi:hypothetical protein
MVWPQVMIMNILCLQFLHGECFPRIVEGPRAGQECAQVHLEHKGDPGLNKYSY